MSKSSPYSLSSSSQVTSPSPTGVVNSTDRTSPVTGWIQKSISTSWLRTRRAVMTSTRSAGAVAEMWYRSAPSRSSMPTNSTSVRPSISGCQPPVGSKNNEGSRSIPAGSGSNSPVIGLDNQMSSSRATAPSSLTRPPSHLDLEDRLGGSRHGELADDAVQRELIDLVDVDGSTAAPELEADALGGTHRGGRGVDDRGGIGGDRRFGGLVGSVATTGREHERYGERPTTPRLRDMPASDGGGVVGSCRSWSCPREMADTRSVGVGRVAGRTHTQPCLITAYSGCRGVECQGRSRVGRTGFGDRGVRRGRLVARLCRCPTSACQRATMRRFVVGCVDKRRRSPRRSLRSASSSERQPQRRGSDLSRRSATRSSCSPGVRSSQRSRSSATVARSHRRRSPDCCSTFARWRSA